MILKRSLKTYIFKASNYTRMLLTGRINLGGESYKLKTFRQMRMPIDSSYRNYEEEVKRFFKRELATSTGHFIDVGVNFGQTLIAILDIDKNIPYVGVEPQPICAAEVNSFIRTNDLQNHYVICACLGDSNELIALNIKNDGDVNASTITDFRPAETLPNKLFSVAITGDKLLESLKIRDVAILKIDVEGAELEVLKSFKSSLEALKPTIIFEILPHKLVYNGEPLDEDTVQVRVRRENDIRLFLEGVKYQTFLLLPNGDEEACQVSACPDGKIRNYIARPAS
jgi:FkbM family methyltransferase